MDNEVLTVVYGGVGDVSNGGRLDDVANDEFLDGLVLGGATTAVGAADRTDVAASLLVAPVVAPFHSLKCADQTFLAKECCSPFLQRLI